MEDYVLDDLSYEEARQMKDSLALLGLDAELSPHGLTIHIPKPPTNDVMELIKQCPAPNGIDELSNWLNKLLRLAG